MSVNIAPKSLDTELSDLMRNVALGRIQLPEFQRDWTWDDNRIRGILASLSLGYPMGAIMQLEYGNESVRFKYRAFEGTNISDVKPESLVLDGQQRLTSIFRAACSKEPVTTKTEKGKSVERFYYLDIKKCLDENEDRVDAIIPVPKDRCLKANFDRDIVLDLSTREREYEHEMFPINLIFDSNAREDWADGYKEYHGYQRTFLDRYRAFRVDVIETIAGYKLPVITLGKETPRDAVCKVFENVNTGGVPLTVFELVTASFATYGFDLRKDWENCRNIIWGINRDLNSDLMKGVDQTDFLTTITLYTSFFAPTMTTCKKKDVLALSYQDYEANKGAIIDGYQMAREFLLSQSVFKKHDLPYTTQLIPLTAICAVVGRSTFNLPETQTVLSRWFWCGIMGEMYGGANETRYANDIEDVVAEIRGEETMNRTVNAAFFSASRLLSLQTRNSAAYKGIMALIYKEDSKDFVRGTTMDVIRSVEDTPDIHHIFPEAYCIRKKYPKEKWNSIVNKTPLLPASNRQIGGDAPSVYSKRIKTKARIDEAKYRSRIESHLIDYSSFIRDDFDTYFILRAKALLRIIESAMGKKVPDRASEQTIKAFGEALEENEPAVSAE